MATVSLSSLTHFLKGQFAPGQPQEEVIQATASPLYQLMPKNTQLGGEYLKVPVTYGLLMGSTTFTTAQSNSGTMAAKAFKVDVDGATPHDYTTVDIAGQVFRSANIDKFAFFKQITGHINAAIRTQARRRAMMVYRTSVGTIGTIHASTTLASTTLLLAQRGEGRLIEAGNKLSFQDYSSSWDLLDSGEALTVSAIDRSADPVSLTVSANVSTISGVATGDGIIFEGDNDGWPTGLLSWLPSTAPTSGDSFHGVDRSADPVRLAGHRLNCTGKDVLSGLIEGIHLLGEEGNMNLAAFVTPEAFHALVELIRASTTYEAKTVSTPARVMPSENNPSGVSQKVSVKGLLIDGPDGTVTVYRDLFCPATYGFIGEIDRFTLYSMGVDPGILEEDGNMVLRKATADSYEVRVGGYPQVVCDGPGRWMNLYNYAP